MLEKRGFTLIELMVAMAIVGILAATAMVNFGKNDDRDVRAEKDRLTSFIREVQNKALAGDKENIPESAVKVCGFGFRQPFAPTRGSTIYRNEIESFYTYTTDLDGDCSSLWETYPSVKLDTFRPSNRIVLGFRGSVFFLSPNGNVDCKSCTLPGSVTITKSGASASVTIHESGRIY